MSINWVWEGRGEAEFQTPEVSSIYEGWKPWQGDMASSISVHAEIFAREITQNFVDASREQIQAAGAIKPKLSFEFLEFTGEEAAALRTRLGLNAIVAQYKEFSDTDLRSLKLPETDFYDNSSKLRLLIARESGTTGMYGPWVRDDRVFDEQGKRIWRKMRDALLSTVGSKGDVGLGSYGEGKRAIIGASKVRTLFTYTAFAPETNPEGVSRRFLGSTYWRAHEVGAKAYSGLALLGERSTATSRPEPLTDSTADEFVSFLDVPGFFVRDASSPLNFGTTQIFVDPDLNAGDLASALERNWWPLLVDGKIELSVRDGQKEYDVDPSSRPELAKFIEGYLDLKSMTASHEQTEFKTIKVKNESTLAGKLALLADTSDGGWSYANLETNRSLVALIREGMIISYQMLPKEKALPAPFVRGVFVVNKEEVGDVEAKLRAVEPPLHNYWNTGNSAMERDAVAIAKEVYKILRQELLDYREKFIQEQVRKETGLELFDELLSSAGGKRVYGKKEPIGPNQRDEWSILSVDAGIRATDDGSSRIATAARKVSLRKNAETQAVAIELGWEVLGDDGAWESDPHLRSVPISAASGFELNVNRYHGILEPNQTYEFKWDSTPYADLWTVRPFLKVIAEALPNELEEIDVE